MKSDYISVIIKSLDKKIQSLTGYKEITEKIIESDFESLANYIAQRQLIVVEVDKITLEIKGVILEQPNDVQNVLTQIIAFKKIIYNEKYKALIEKATELESLLISISEREKLARIQMEQIKKELENEMMKSNKSRQIIDYCNSFASINSKGNNLNSLT